MQFPKVDTPSSFKHIKIRIPFPSKTGKCKSPSSNRWKTPQKIPSNSEVFVMDSKEEHNADGDRRHMAAENSDTVALNKKRVRRVSFAETTSVYFFDRDEEFNETSQVETAKMADDSPAGFRLRGLSERGKVFGGEDDGGDSLEDEIMEMQRSFLQPVRSPSSGGSLMGSACEFHCLAIFMVVFCVLLSVYCVR